MENLAHGFKNFLKGEGFPRFKSKYERKQSFRTRGCISVMKNAIKIPKVKTPVRAVLHREMEGTPKQMTISKKCEKYYVSIMVELEANVQPVEIKKEVGLDLGVLDFATLDNGETIANPRFFRGGKDYIAVLLQKLARAKKASNNWVKLKAKLANAYKKIANKRSLFLHENSRRLVNKYDRIYIENLNVKGMTASAKGTVEKPGINVKQKSALNRNIRDVALGEFVTQLEYKAKFEGKDVVKVNRFYASSKICSNCGYKNKALTLAIREWVCPQCGKEHQRDVNSAINIKAEGRRSLSNRKIQKE